MLDNYKDLMIAMNYKHHDDNKSSDNAPHTTV